MRADEVAEALGKSTSTAYNLLDTPLPGKASLSVDRAAYLASTAKSAAMVPPGMRARDTPCRTWCLDEAPQRDTHKRVYLAAAHSARSLVTPPGGALRGHAAHAGPGSASIRSSARRLVLGKGRALAAL